MTRGLTKAAVIAEPATGAGNNRLRAADRAGHDWYRFVLSFPPHLARTYLDILEVNILSLVLDPFCGTGTTLVECKKTGIRSAGIEANPMACFASETKVDWTPDPAALLSHARGVASAAAARFAAEGLPEHDTAGLPLFAGGTLADPASLQTLPAEAAPLLLKDSISPLPLHRTLVLLDVLREQHDARFVRHERLAIAKALVSGISNLSFGPEVGVGPAKADAPALALWMDNIRAISHDLRSLRSHSPVSSVVHAGDARNPIRFLDPCSVDAVITSPPYPNEKDYTRTTRLESVLLGFIESKEHLRALKQGLVRSNTRNVYKGDDDDLLVANHEEIQELAAEIERRRIELGKTSGFERQYARVTKLYFGGMARHLAELRAALRPGARLAYVVGDQASYLRVMIRTGRLLADIARSLGYEVMGIDLFRTRLATATGEQLREEVVVLKWPG